MKKLTNREKRLRLEKSRRDGRVKALKKLRPLCVCKGFVELAYEKKWDNETVDAAAIFMHRCFIGQRRRKESNDDWISIPWQTWEGMYGAKYLSIKKKLIEDGLIEYNELRRFKKGSHCSEFRLTEKFRDAFIDASYRLQSKGFQERYRDYHRQFRMSDAKRRKAVKQIIKIAFSPNNDDTFDAEEKWPQGYWVRSYYELVEQNHLTEREFVTIERLAQCTLSMKLNISEEEVVAIANRRFKKKSQKCSEEAFQQKYLWMADRTREARLSIKGNGRFYTPFANLPKEMWDRVEFNGRRLAYIDVPASHPHCLLVLLKDISQAYFGNSGTHDERLARCRFSRQIARVPGLVDHLRRNSEMMQAADHFEYRSTLRKNRKGREVESYEIFKKFAKKSIQIMNDVAKDYRTSKSAISCDFLQNLKYRYELNGLSMSENQISEPVENVHDIYVIPTDPSVGIGPQLDYCKAVMSLIHACRFSPKPNETGVSVNDNPMVGTPLFRDMFFPCDEEIANYEQALSGDIYILMMKELGLVNRSERKKFKTELLRFLYRPALSRKDTIYYWDDGPVKERIDNPIRKAFESLFPAITLFLDICKCRPCTLNRRGDQYKWLARAIQSIESQIILECCDNLWEKYPKMFLTTLHDCIKCLPRDAEKVREEMKRTFLKYGVDLSFEIKQHGDEYGI